MEEKDKTLSAGVFRFEGWASFVAFLAHQ